MSDFLNPHLTRPAVRWTSGDALPAIEQTGPAAPLLVDATTGRLMVDTEANLTADLSLIEGKQDTTNAILTTTAADVATIKSGSPSRTQDGSGTAITSTNVSGKQALDVNVVAGGGGGGGGASAAYNATLPTYTSGASTTLQTDVNGRLITTGGLTDTQLRASAVPVSLASVPSHPVTNAGTFAVQPSAGDLTSGNAKTQIVNGANTLAVDSTGAITSNNAASQVYNYTATGAVAGTPVIISPIDCASIREISVQLVSAGTGFSMQAQISNDNTNWVAANFVNSGGTVSSGASVSIAIFYNYQVFGAKYFRIQQSTAQTAGTTTLVAYASQQATPKLFQTVTVGSGLVTNTVQPNQNFGFGSFHSLVSAASTNATSVKTSVGAIGTLVLTNSSATWAYFKIVNKASAPTVGTDTAIINIGVAPNTTLDCSTSFAGLRLSTGIAYYVSAGASLTDNTALPAAGTFLVNMTYV